MKIKTILLLSVLALTSVFICNAGSGHPHLFYDKADFISLKETISSGATAAMTRLHECAMQAADDAVADTSRLRYVKDASNRRILQVSRKALNRLVPCAYAYKMTGKKKYLRKVEGDLKAVCSFDDWNYSHFLDASEMATGVAIAYDWLYPALKESLKAEIERALLEYALEPSFYQENGKDWWFFKTANNWNQVCNGGLVCAALAMQEKCPEMSRKVIDRAVATNRPVLGKMYAPDGAYPEGPGYWSYGTLFEVMLLTALEKSCGTDYDLSQAPGFMATDLFKIHSTGTSGKVFNFADNTETCHSNMSLWYFAAKKHDPNLLFTEIALMNSPKYAQSGERWFLPIALKHAMRLDLKDVKAPESGFYAAQGEIPVMMCRSGWDKQDHYLGIKGGRANYNHGHMDAGTFVYDAYGIRWAMDYNRQGYATVESGIKALGGRLIKGHQESLRWRLFRLNCRQHNTLTVNDKDHNVKGNVKMIATEDSKTRMSATFDMTPLFFGDIVRAERTAALCDGECLEIRDVLQTPEDKPAHVRWTMLTEAKPSITKDGIVLTRKGVKMLLKAEGAEVKYKIWSTDPQDYDSPLKHLDAPNKGTYLCGYEVSVPKSAEYEIIVTLQKTDL